MGATVFVQPLDLVKNRMQLSGKPEKPCKLSLFVLTNVGEGGAARKHKTSFHAIARVIGEEGLFGIYNGFVACCFSE